MNDRAAATHGESVHREGEHAGSPYKQLVLMALVHLPLMYAVMFTMVYSWSEVVHNLNTFYMAGMMVAPMIILMPIMMKSMYPNRRANLLVYASSVALFAVLFSFLRNQAFVGDAQFLKSMIPHHSGAILMCEEAKLSNPELKVLCSDIIKAQKAEIAQMKELLSRM